MHNEGSFEGKRQEQGAKCKSINTKQNGSLILLWSAADGILYFPDRPL